MTIEYLAIQKGYITKRVREGSSEVADERMSQVSASIDGSLPEALKSGE